MKPQPHGGTLRDEIKLYERAMGAPHPEGRAPVTPPQSIGYLWRWFHELGAGRPIGGMGSLMPIPPSEILAWCTLKGITLKDWELDCLRNIDAAFLRVMSAKD